MCAGFSTENRIFDLLFFIYILRTNKPYTCMAYFLLRPSKKGTSARRPDELAGCWLGMLLLFHFSCREGSGFLVERKKGALRCVDWIRFHAGGFGLLLLLSGPLPT